MTSPPLAILSNNLSTQNKADGDWLDDMNLNPAWSRRYAFDRIEDIPGILSQCADAGVETIAVDGGDGTAGLVFSGLLNDGPFGTLPALALLPSGKTNMTAEAWSLTGHRHTALDRLLQLHRDNTLASTVHSQAVVTLQDGVSAQPKHGAFFGGADVVDGILYCRRNIYPLGLPNAISHTAAVFVLLWRALFLGNQSGTLSAKFDESDLGEEGHFFIVLATTMNRMLLGIRPAPIVGDGPLHYMSLRPGPVSILSTFPSVAGRRVGASRARTVRRTKSVTIASTGQYTLDGELYQATSDTPLTISSHQALRFVQW